MPFLRVLRPLPKSNGIRIEVHTRDHPPPHFHLEIPPGSEVGHGYRWPDLTPVWKGEAPLSRKRRRQVEDHIEHHRALLLERLKGTYGAQVESIDS